MICTLMHKRMDVAELEMDDATGFIHKVNAIYAPEHLPVGVLQTNGIIDRTASYFAENGTNSASGRCELFY